VKSESIAKLAEALSKAQAAMDTAKKDSTNPHFKSKYADLASVWDACRKPMTDAGLSVTQVLKGDGADLILSTLLMHASGEWIESLIPVRPVQNTPQGMGSALTYARRYALAAILGVVADEDDDGNAGSQGHGGSQGSPYQRPASRQPPPEAPKPQPQEQTAVYVATAPQKRWLHERMATAGLVGKTLTSDEQRYLNEASQSFMSWPLQKVEEQITRIAAGEHEGG
jgi:ERF superfamily